MPDPSRYNCARRMGWTPFVALLLIVGVLLVPERRWGRAWWLSWALLSIACAACALHLASGSVWSGWGHVFDIVVFVILSAISALAAVFGAVHTTRKRGVDPGQPPTIPEAPTGSPV